MLFPAVALGADIGLSAAIGDAGQIRIPIKTENFLLEPYISHFSYGDDYNEGALESNYDETKSTELGIGIWKLIDLNDKFYAQLGLDLGYLESSSQNKSVTDDLLTYQYLAGRDGYVIAPGFGLFYALNSNFEIGVEAKYRYKRMEGESSSSNEFRDEPTTVLSSNYSRLKTHAVFRLFF